MNIHSLILRKPHFDDLMVNLYFDGKRVKPNIVMVKIHSLRIKNMGFSPKTKEEPYI